MAIAFNAATNGGNVNPGSSLTFSHTVSSGSNRMLVVAITGDYVVGNDKITGVTYGGTTMTQGDKHYFADGGSGNASWMYWYYLMNPTSGANNVVISASGSQTIIACAADYTGVKQTGNPVTLANNHSVSGGNPLTSSITTTVVNSWVILTEWGYSGGTAPLAGTGDVRRVYDTSFGACGMFDSNTALASPGSFSMTTSYSGSVPQMAHLLAEIQPDTGGAASFLARPYYDMSNRNI